MDWSQTKIAWKGEVVSVQVRSVVWRLACNRTHREMGYHLFIRGEAHACDGGEPFVPFHLRSGFDLCIAVSEKQQEKHGFRVGDTVRGTGWTPLYPETTFADFYRAGALKVLGRRMWDDPAPTRVLYDDEFPSSGGVSIPRVFSSEYPGPPWTMAAPPVDVYGWRGARMLSLASWKAGCLPCVWASMAEVAVEYDFDRGTVKNRFESFCYGPLSCPRYKRGPARSVPYRGRESAVDDGAFDEMFIDKRVSDDE